MGSLREDLESASASITESAPAESAPEPVADATPTPEPAEASATAPETPRPDGRDEKGRFAPKATAGDSPGQAAPPKVPPTPEGAASSTQPPTPAEVTKTEPPRPGEPDTTHAPASWPIGARSQWEKIPPELRKVIHTRELQAAQAVSRADPARRFQEETHRALAPILPVLQQRGITPQKLIASYAQFDQALSSKDPAAQAHAIAQVIKGYNVPIEVLADALDGKLGAPQPRQLSVEEIREQLKNEMRQEWQQNQQQLEYKSHAQKVAEFSKAVDPVLFNDDVRHDMAALIEAAAARNIELSLQDAYDRAIRANPDAWAIVQQREAAKRAATELPATRRAEAAASSLKSRPASPVGKSSSGNSLRADLEEEAAKYAGRT